MAQDAIDYKVVVIGGSAGSLEVVLDIITGVNITTNAFYIIVLHRRNDADSSLRHLFYFRTKMQVKEVEDKDKTAPGNIYIAPPDYHLLLDDASTFSLDSSEKINYSRPSIDVTFESVADVFGEQAIGILLSGANADGAKGLKKIKQHNGYTIVQNPETAGISFMPKHAVEYFTPDCIIDGKQIAGVINRLIVN